MNHEFTFELGQVFVDGREASSAELMDILVYQQKEIERLEEEIDLLDMGKMKRTYGGRKERTS